MNLNTQLHDAPCCPCQVITWGVHGASSCLLSEAQIDLAQLFIEPLQLCLALSGSDAAHQRPRQGHKLRDADNVYAEWRGTQLANLQQVAQAMSAWAADWGPAVQGRLLRDPREADMS